MSLDVKKVESIRTPFDQLPKRIREQLVNVYMGEEKYDLVLMYLQNLNVEQVVNRLDWHEIDYE
jgi:hypothetical protein